MPDAANLGTAIVLVLALTAGGTTPQTVPPPGEQISADCALPVYATDRLVCSDSALRALDARMLRLWRMSEARHRSDAAAILDSQLAWFRSRSLCAFETDHRACVIATYRNRIEILQAPADAD